MASAWNHFLEKARRRFLPGLVLLVFLAGSVVSCRQDEKTKLRVFIAGSLIIPADDLERAYEAAHPDVDVEMEAHGSIQVIRHVTEIHDEIDVVIPADYYLIPMLMYPNTVPETGEPYADWYIRFATNDLALAYTPDSLYADEINSENWYEILARSDVSVGLSDPRFDASGYRTLMVLQLAEAYYDQPSIFERVFMGQFKQNVRVRRDAERYSIHVPELLEPSPTTHMAMRGSSVALISLLESGDIDYSFQYDSVIQQQGLEYLRLPDEINLGDQDFAERYANVQVELDFQRFSSVQPLFSGEVISYGVTIPSNAPHPEVAEDFVRFLLGPEGRAILQDNQHPLLETPLSDNHEALPAALQSLCEPEW